MRRREFIGLLGSAAATWPLGARAQSGMPVVGFLNGQSLGTYRHAATAFRRGLQDAGFVENENVSIAFRWADGRDERIPALATDLIANRVAVIATGGSLQTTLTVKRATTTTPLVFVTGSDPVRYGIVSSLNHPGGNVTGVSFLVNLLNAKRLEIAGQLVGSGSPVGLLIRSTNPTSASDKRDIEAAAQMLGLNLLAFDVAGEHDFEAAFAAAARQRVSALMVHTDPFFNSHRGTLVALAARHALPTIHELREFVVAGGLISYGTSITEAYRQAGRYAGRILKGEKPADLPVIQSTHFELAINLKTAATLGLSIPPTLLALADEVIE